jgi:uncharacterized protein (TIGR03083 family)
MADDSTLMWDEVADIGRLLHVLEDDEFDTPSLCDGWAVRDVLGHMALGHTTPIGTTMARIAKHAFNVTKASYNESKTPFAGKSGDEIRHFWDDVIVADRPRRGISRLIPNRVNFLDHLVHNQDMRRPTGHSRQVPEERLRRALELVRTEGTPMFSPKKNVAGLKLVATDIDWSGGDGPGIEGAAEALVLAASGRMAALADLSGEGMNTLSSRLA